MLKMDPAIEEDQLKVVLSTIASLSKHSFLNRTEHITLLISYASKDCGQDLMCQVLNDLVLMQDAQAILSSTDLLVRCENTMQSPQIHNFNIECTELDENWW